MSRRLVATLVAALTLLVIAPAAHAADYVALGDSYASGNGTRQYDYDAVEGCKRSTLAYPHRIKGDFGTTFDFQACSGGTTSSVLSSQVQKLSADTDYVTVQVGGNDAGFSDTVTQCLLPDVGQCNDKLDQAEAFIRDELAGRLNQVYTQVQTRAPNATVVVVGYPRLFNSQRPDCHAFTWFGEDETERMNLMADLLAGVTKARAQAYGFGFVDVRSRFLGHAVCDNPEWINNLSNPVQDSFHPNAAGQGTGFTPLVRASLSDGVAPQSQILSGPIGATNDNTPTFGFASDDATATFECRVDTGAWQACSSPRTTATLGEGAHTFSIRASDTVGFTETTPKSRSFTVDTIKPAAPSTVAPPSPTKLTQPELAFTGEAGATFECATDSGTFAACESPYTPAALGDGTHALKVVAIDAAGNRSTTASRNVTVDTIPPAAPEQTAPASPTASKQPQFGFTGEAGTTFECAVDGGTFASCASPFTPDALDDGEHTLSVVALDPAGNRSEAVSSTVVVDTTAPATTIDGGPEGLVDSADASFAFSSEDGATFACRIDDGDFGACTSPFAVTDLDEGDHVFEVRATDALGNAASTAERREFTVDTIAPAAPTLGGPSGAIADVAPSFTIDHDDADVTFACAVGTADPEPCTSPYAPGSLTDGAYTISVTTTDAAGNASPAATRTVTVDTTAPTTAIDGGPDGPTADATPAFTFGAEAGATYECRIDAGAFADCASPFVAGELSDGDHAFEVRATDALGNAATTAARREFSVDTVAPVTTIQTGPTGTIAEPTASFTFFAEDGAAFECRLDDGDFADCASPFTTAALADGDHVFEVRATDAVGNVEADAVQRAFRVDTTPPATNGGDPLPDPPAFGGGGTGTTPTTPTAPSVTGESQSRSVAGTLTAPVLSQVRLTRKVLTRKGRTAKSLLRFRLSAAAKLTVKLERRTGKKRRYRYRTARTLTANGKAGAGQLTIAVRSKGKALARGTYRLTITPQAGKQVRLLFRVTG